MRRRDFLRRGGAAGGLLAAGVGRARRAAAQGREDTLVTVSEGGPNSLDTEVAGANRACTEVTWNCYDRLLTFGSTQDDQGIDHYNPNDLRPELAEDWFIHGTSCTFKLRRNVRFHDGTPVTAKDVKWSFDRVLMNGGYPKFVYNAISLTKPEQFVVVDDRTFRIDYERRDRYTLPFLGSPVGLVYNSGLVKKNATADDPWGLNFTKRNTAGSGAYTVAAWTPGQDVTFVRNDDWTGGKPPPVKRIIWRAVPSAGTRRALLERGDVDLSFDLPPKDVAELAQDRSLNVISAPMDCTAVYLSLNTKLPPFDNLKVRQAIAHAIPFHDIVRLSLFGRGRALDGGPAKVTSAAWPQQGPYATDLAKAKELLTEAGYPDGFETTLSFDQSAAVTNEPTSLLIQGNLAKIGIRASLNKIPGANWRSEFAAHKLPMLLNIFGGWLSNKYFYFGWLYYGQGQLWNTAQYANPSMDKLIDDAHFTPSDRTAAADEMRYIQLAFDDLPYVPIYQPNFNVATRRNVGGYRYWFFQQLDYRTLTKA